MESSSTLINTRSETARSTEVVVAAAPSAGTRLKNARHERYARLCLEYPQHEAYRRAMGKMLQPATKPSSVYERASRLAARQDIARRIIELRQVAAQTTALDLQERVSELRDIESADATAIQYRPACRHCNGVGHAYQHIDLTEYAEALQKALDESKPLPSDAGGYGYDGSLHPNPQCPRCFGGGAEHLYMADITRLPRREARLVRGFGKNGELVLHDQLVARAQLSKLLGLDRPNGAQLAREAAAAAAGAAIGSSVAAALTPEERMRAYLTMLKG